MILTESNLDDQQPCSSPSRSLPPNEFINFSTHKLFYFNSLSDLCSEGSETSCEAGSSRSSTDLEVITPTLACVANKTIQVFQKFTCSRATYDAAMAELTFDTLMDDGNYLGTERARRENEVVLKELDRKKMARTGMAVPTDDNRVKARLREIGEPITLFGERVCAPSCHSDAAFRTSHRQQIVGTVSYMSCLKLMRRAGTISCILMKSLQKRAMMKYVFWCPCSMGGD